MTSQNFYLNLLNDGATPSDTATRVESLIAQLKASHTDITSGYTEWLKVGFAIASEFGETGRTYFHDISALYTGYDATECDKKYDECLKSDNGRTNIATLFYLAEQQGVKLPYQERNISKEQGQISTNATSDKNVAVSFVESQAEDRTLPLLDPSVYTNLPSILRKAVDTMHIRQEKDLVLIGSIVTLSSVLLPFRTIFHGRTIFPNMFLFVPGPAGSGKGRLDFCYRLVRPIHNDKRELWQLQQEEYKQELDRYRAAEVDLPQALFHFVNSPAVPGDGLGVCAELLAEGDGHGVHHLGPAQLRKPVVRILLDLEALLQPAAAEAERSHQADGRDPERGGIDVVGRLTHIDVIQWVEKLVLSAFVSHVLQGKICNDLIDVHVGRGSGTALKGIGGKGVGKAVRFPEKFLTGCENGVRLLFRQAASVAVGLCRGLLDRDDGGDELRRDRTAADRKIGDGAGRLNSVQTVFRQRDDTDAVLFFAFFLFHAVHLIPGTSQWRGKLPRSASGCPAYMQLMFRSW